MSETKTFADKAISFNKSIELKLNSDLIGVMNPFKNPEKLELTEIFYRKYFNDNHSRHFLFGINPGRFGAGITGISFTDPINLEKECGIVNNFDKKPELSSQFIYQVISAFGGPLEFYSEFFITAVSPLGFTQNGVNLNYYDSKELMNEVRPFIVKSIREQMDFGAHREVCICIGGNKNYSFLKKLNEEYRFFDEIIPLEHPRFIIQYRRKSVDQYISKYLEALDKCRQTTVL
jgi:hypothetical protein